MSMEYFVYILRCRYGSYYVGLTNALEQRLHQHHQGIYPNCYTYARRPVELVYVTNFKEVSQAITWERQIKRWSRKKKESLIRRNWSQLEKFAACRNYSQYLSKKSLRNRRYEVRHAVHTNCVMVRQSSP